MTSKVTTKSLRIVAICVAVIAQSFVVQSAAFADDKLTEPVYRVANQATVTQPAPTNQPATVAAPAAPATATAVKAPLDLTQRPGEHPLAPVLRTLKTTQEHIDRDVRDYSTTLIKRERVNGQLGDYQHILMKVMHQPFSVYMSFIKPHAGREVVYVNGQNDGKLVVLEAGFTRMLGKISLDPNGARAMNGQKRPITDVGIRNLTEKLTKMWTAESQFAETEVTTKADTKINGRPATMIQVVHPVARENFKFYMARLFFDNELQVPIHFDAFTWPAQQGGEPQPEESYTYSNLKINNNFTARDFDSNNNPEIFKK